MLFHAAERGEPVVFSVVRPGVPVLEARQRGAAGARGDQRRLCVQAVPRQRQAEAGAGVCGGQVMANLLEILPELEERHDVKIVAVTSPQLFEELRQSDPNEGRRDPVR